jgi:hypothetical protein
LRLAVYDNRYTWRIYATCGSALKAESRNRLCPAAGTFSLLHVISELFKATEAGAAAACKQAPASSPVVRLSDKIFGMGRRFDDRAEVATRESEVDVVMKLELLDYAELQFDRRRSR